MKWIPRLSMLVCLLVCGSATGQEQADTTAEQVRQAAERLQREARRVEERAEALAGEHTREMEQWAEQFSGQWESWAERFESKMERWAESQEKAWEKWAEDYSGKWEELGKQLEAGDLDSAEMKELIERNLKMLGEMPLEKMMNGLMSEGLEELQGAPWESLNSLTDRFQDSMEESLRSLEVMSLEDLPNRLQMGKTGDDIHGALEKVREGLEKKLAVLNTDADGRLRQLKQLMQDGSLSDAQVEEIRSVAEAIKSETVRRGAEMKDKARAARQQALELKEAAGKSGRTDDVSSTNSDLVKTMLKAMAESGDLQKKAELDAVREFLVLEAEKKRQAVRSKDSEIEILQQEIEKLRREVDRLKKESGGENPLP